MIHSVGRQADLAEIAAGEIGLVQYDDSPALVFGLSDQGQRAAYVLFEKARTANGQPMMGARIPEENFGNWEDIFILRGAVLRPGLDSLAFSAGNPNGSVVSTSQGNFLRVVDYRGYGGSILIGEGGVVNSSSRSRNNAWHFPRWDILVPAVEAAQPMSPVFSFEAT